VGCRRQLAHAYFSDTILLWAPYELPVVESFLDSVLQFFCEALSNGLPLRGCITFGDAIMDQDQGVFLGEPIIEGSWGEAAQEWVGVAFGPSLERPPFGWVGALRHVIPFAQHIKAGKDDCVLTIALDWPRRWRAVYARRAGVGASECLSRLNTIAGFERYYEKADLLVRASSEDESWWETADFSKLALAGHTAPENAYGKQQRDSAEGG
jgi:hypothetical protein